VVVRRIKQNAEASGSELEPSPVEWFVAQMAADLGIESARAIDYRCRRILYRLTRWATAEGLPLEREIILDPAPSSGSAGPHSPTTAPSGRCALAGPPRRLRLRHARAVNRTTRLADSPL